MSGKVVELSINGTTYLLATDKNKQYEPGDNPCGNCNLYHHKKCRPRLDGTLCSCTCPQSRKLFEAYEEYLTVCQAEGKVPSTLVEVLPVIHKKVKK
jgi:hypothetical protein